jgi:diadenosine tetraphosphate (Ap4A) HIT family hydrolase
MNSDGFTMHPQLVRDTIALGDLPLCRVLIARDANYPWLVLVPRRPDIVEVYDLAEPDQAALITDLARAARALQTVTGCDKINVASLGNAVAQMHVHVIGRRKTDPAWPKPVWGQVPPRAYAEDELSRFVADLRGARDLAGMS